MFVHAVPDNRGKKDGYYCSLVESRRINGVSRHSTLLSFGYIRQERLPYLKAAFNSGDPDHILAKAKCSQEDKRAEPAPPIIKMDNLKLKFIARITMPDGKVIERSVNAEDGIPTPEDFDTSSKEGFLESFDALERVALEARNRIAKDITDAYLDEVSKKNGRTASTGADVPSSPKSGE